jgi:prevent-host-death family protein
MTMKITKLSRSRSVAVGEFKAKCLGLLDDVRNGKTRITVTKNGEPYADVVPHTTEKKPHRSVIGRTPQIRMHDDLIAPLPQEWTLPADMWE